MKVCRPDTYGARFADLLRSALAGSLLLAAPACKPDVIPLDQPDMALEDPPQDPRTVFNEKALVDLQSSCQGCHSQIQDTVKPFLTRGMEYESITTYENGRFLTPDPEQSILLRKGQHIGPAFTSGQYDNVSAWLSLEAAQRGGGMSSPATPSVALRAGDFFISLEKLVADPLAKITFQVEPRGGGFYRFINLKLTAGPLTGIKIKHPRFLIFSQSGSMSDPADSLSGINVTVAAKAEAPLASGAVILNIKPLVARVALAFESIAQVDPRPPGSFQCKDFAQFNAKVNPTLTAPCALLCHGQGATDPRASQAFGAFDMTLARSQVDAEQKQFCVRTLGRVNLADPQRSVLVLQPTPKENGGTENHPYKLPGFMSFTQAVVSWAAAEK